MKKILCILLIIFISGCSVRYELNISNDNINENLIIMGNVSDIPSQADLVYSATHDYSKNIDNGILNYSTNYNLLNLNKSDFLTCFDSYGFVNDDDYYILRTGKKFSCLPYQYNDYDIMDYDELEIVISTNHKVVENNASKVIGNKYYWYINKNNVDNSEIYLKFSKNVIGIPIWFSLSIIFGIIFVVGFIVYKIVKSKSDKNNQI